jgi:biotin operon repressor
LDAQQELADRLVDVFRALGDPVRLRLLGLIAERPRTGKELADAVSVGAPTVSHHMDRLVRSGLVSVERVGQSRIYSLNQATLQAISQLARGAAGENQALPEAENAEERERAKVLRDFFDGDRLKQIPAQRRKRVIALQHLLSRFEPDQEYSEKEINAVLKTAHDDFATLRRELVDYGFITRAGGVYRVARDLPTRSAQVRQEIPGDETAWLRRLLASAAHPG